MIDIHRVTCCILKFILKFLVYFLVSIWQLPFSHIVLKFLLINRSSCEEGGLILSQLTFEEDSQNMSLNLEVLIFGNIVQEVRHFY